jgi:LuxR family transcriptional regulator, quorum-sensing system regulator CviR
MFASGADGLGLQLSGADAIKLLELIGTCLSCRDEADFRAIFSKIQELFPFDFAIAALGGRDKDQVALPVYTVNVSFPMAWIREYQSKNYLQVDSVVQESFRSYDLQTWSVARKSRFRRKEITSLGMDFGMRECCTHGSQPLSGRGHGSMFCFASPSIKSTTRTKVILDILTPHLHMVLSEMHNKSKYCGHTMALSTREKEVVDWLKQGKSSWEISAILKISERTVNFHVGNIIQKLGVVNRAQAVAVAVRSGLIDIV